MAYISSKDNRFYVAIEQSYGQAAASGALNRIPAVKLTTQQERERTNRKDKTGSRTFAGFPAGGRRTTTFELQTYMRDWSDPSKEPGYGPLFQACLGRPAAMSGPLSVSSVASPNRVMFGTPHGLTPGQAVAYGADLRFVVAVVDDHSVQLNAPFSAPVASGAMTGPTATYLPSSDLSSATIFDAWSPGTAVQRLIYGAAVDQLQIGVNGDFHTFQFSGPACDVADSASFQQGQGGLNAFPAEPVLATYDYSIIPGHLGQVWLGSAPDQFFTLTAATVKVTNQANLRDHEFGSTYARGMSAGMRSIEVDFSIYQQDDTQTKALYQAARQESPISAMIQLGQQPGQLAGIYLQDLMLTTPAFDDGEDRQQWIFKNCRAQGISDDEISIAFG